MFDFVGDITNVQIPNIHKVYMREKRQVKSIGEKVYARVFFDSRMHWDMHSLIVISQAPCIREHAPHLY